jgi:hypothetical protein
VKKTNDLCRCLDLRLIAPRGLLDGSLWLDELATGYRWALEHDRPTPFRPHPWPWPPLEQRAS